MKVYRDLAEEFMSTLRHENAESRRSRLRRGVYFFHQSSTGTEILAVFPSRARTVPIRFANRSKRPPPESPDATRAVVRIASLLSSSIMTLVNVPEESVGVPEGYQQ